MSYSGWKMVQFFLPIQRLDPSKPYEYKSSPIPFPPHFSPPPG